jgi:hypothetical protein
MLPRPISFALFAACISFGPPAFAQYLPSPGSLLARSSWCRLDIVAGRVTLVEPRLGHKATVTSESPDGQPAEVLAFCATDVDSASLRYEYLDDQQQWLVDIQLSRQVLIQRRPQADSPVVAVQYRQPELGPVSLEVQQRDRTLRVVATDFWRLFLAAPELCSEHLIPILEAMRPDWQLATLGRRVEHALLAKAAAGSRLERQELDALVEQLGDREFRRRQAADRQLRSLGQQVVGYLSRLDLDHLNAEQRIRLQRIRQTLQVTDSDSPERVATWLIDDPATWISLLGRQDQTARMAAARHLDSLLDRPLRFDALATAPERARQLARLQDELGISRSEMVGQTSGGKTLR